MNTVQLQKVHGNIMRRSLKQQTIDDYKGSLWHSSTNDEPQLTIGDEIPMVYALFSI